MILYQKKTGGFTLLEIMVVVAIIGILTSVVAFAINRAQERARDASSIAEFKQLDVVLGEFYDKHGVYPCGHMIGNNAWVLGTNLYDWQDPNWVNDSFLDGAHGTGYADTAFCTAPWDGLATDGLISGTIKPSHNYYFYEIERSPQGPPRQKFLLSTVLENDTEAMQKDGGFCSNIYEIGPGVGIIHPLALTTIYGCN